MEARKGPYSGMKPENLEKTQVTGQVTRYFFTSGRGIEPQPPRSKASVGYHCVIRPPKCTQLGYQGYNRFPFELVLLLMIPVIAAEITPIPYPKEVKECLKTEENLDASLCTGESIASTCMSTYAWNNKAKVHPYLPSKPEKDYIHQMSGNPRHERVKRGTFPRRGKPRQRKEYRLLTNKARDRFHMCLNLLKNTPVPGSSISRYDAIAAMHNSQVAGSAHGGVNFLSWHRVYIYTLENALRSVDRRCRRVTLPYWDCTAEYYSDQIRRGDSANSVIFSDEFAGNADGAVVTGAFREWGLVRNIAFGGLLFGRDEIDLVLSRTSHEEISVPFAQRRYNLEFYHNRIHVFLGGFLLDISLAPRDPLFFLLHTFIDYVWELFRQSLIDRGIDPEIYPQFNNPRHAPDNTMEGFPDWENWEGYLNDWNDRIAQYKPSFNCDRTKNCRKGPRRDRWIGCRTTDDFGRQCVSLPRSNNQDGARRRRSTYKTGKTSHTKVQLCNKDTCPYQEASVQNTYAINDKVDPSSWVYIPVKVLYERSSGLVFHTYDTFENKIDIMDIFDPSRSYKLKKNLYTGQARTYDSCRVSGTGATKVYVRADGISYSGNSMEYAIVDERYPIMVQKAFIPVKDPAKEASEVCLMAYDECGRICLPTCLVKGSNPPVYVPCSGCIRVDNQYPRRYGKTVADAMAEYWSFHDVHDDEYICPEEKEQGQIFLKFVCDSSTKFPWQRMGDRD
ncbi:uncharacterized protein LOC117341979 [Pecten maximus]|uniref:uncharacterized protein LOC117341979 n=1 Tax=Pecten maximus TaxID=6579 RepID=UPI001458260E|nr:uncharacterized protein LOC117341979 [Pecten maximus]